MNANQIVIGGNLGKDPEAKFTPSGKKTATASIAVNREWTGADGEKKKETFWCSLNFWGDGFIDKLLVPYVHKGDYIVVSGRLNIRKWTDENGVDKWFTEVVVSQLLAHTPKREEGAAPRPSAAGAGGSQVDEALPPEDDIPF